MKKILGFLGFLFAALATVAAVDPLVAHGMGLGLANIGAMGVYDDVSYGKVKALFSGPDGKCPFIVAPSFCRLERTVSNGQTTYTFDPRQTSMNTGNNSITNSSLSAGVADNDIFVATKWRLYIDGRATATPGLVELQTYANVTAFTASITATRNMNVFFNSKLSFQVGSTVLIDQTSTVPFLDIPQTQQAAATTWSQNSIYESLIPCRPFHIISGRAANVYTLTTPDLTGLTLTALSGYQNVLTLYLDGYVVKNAANADSPLQWISAYQSGRPVPGISL